MHIFHLLLFVRKLIYSCCSTMYLCGRFIIKMFFRGRVGNIHNPFVLYHPPCNVASFPLYILNPSFVYSTRYPASQNFCVDISDCCKSGTMCDSVASSGNLPMSKLRVCVDRTTVPLGRLIFISFFAIFTFFTGAFGVRKFPVAPVSDIPCFFRNLVLEVSPILVVR